MFSYFVYVGTIFGSGDTPVGTAIKFQVLLKKKLAMFVLSK